MSEENLKNLSKSHKILLQRGGTASQDDLKLKLESIMSDVKYPKLSKYTPKKQTSDEETTVKLKRDFWVRQLQDVYNQIYETFVETLESCRAQYHSIYRNEGPPLTKTAKRIFRNSMRKQQKNMLQIIAELTDKDDAFLRNEDNQAFANQFKTGILEMHGLLAILLSMEVNINKLETADKSKQGISDNCQPLSEEIKKSTSRMQKLKAGSRLNKVIYDSIVQQGEEIDGTKQENTQNLQVLQNKNERANSQKKNNNNNRQVSFLRFSESLKEFDDQAYPPATHKLITPQNPNQIDQSQQQTPDKLDMQKILQDFENQKKNLEKMTNEFISEVGKPGFSFKKKYSYLQNYFEERYKLMGMYFGDPLMRDFMGQRARAIEKAKKLEEDKRGFVLENNIDIINTKLYQDLDASIQHFKNEKNEAALKKLGQLNQEIKNDLLEEEHNQRMKQLNEIAIQNTQKEWAISTNQKVSQTNREVQHKKHAETMKQNRVKQSRGDSVELIRSYRMLSNSTLNFKSHSIQSSPVKQRQNQQIMFTERISLPIKRNPIYKHSSYHENSSPAADKQLIYKDRKINHPECLKFAHVQHNSVTSEIVSTLLKLKISEKIRKDKILSPNSTLNTDKLLEFENSFQQNQKFTSTLTSFRTKKPASSQQIESNETELILSPRKQSQMDQQEEMKAILNKTRGDSPLYLSKFTSVPKNRRFREHIKSERQLGRLNNQIPELSGKNTPSLLSTSSAFSTTIQFTNSIQGNSTKSANFTNFLKRDQPTQTRKGSKLEDTITSTQLDKYKVVKEKNNNNSNEEEQRKRRQQIYENEIPDIFRPSQQDLLFKINGTVWKSKEQKNM